jgi:hypothetical protein
MTALASPAQGGSERLGLRRVDMNAGRTGPVHVVDSERRDGRVPAPRALV